MPAALSTLISPTRRSTLAIAVIAGFLGALPLSSPALAEAGARPNLDVPYVPTPEDVVARMLSIADVGNRDFVIDLGSGDGRIAIAAVKDRGARGALGVDIDPTRVNEAQLNAKAAGVSDAVEFRQQNLFETQLDKASVITMYLLPRINLELRPRLLDLKPGTRLVSHAFTMGDWGPDATARVGNNDIYFWYVPAKVEGRWNVQAADGNFTIDLTQQFQKITGTALVGGASLPLRDTRLEGDRLDFNIEVSPGKVVTYSGKVDGNSIEALSATKTDPRRATGWRATRS